MKFQEMTNAGDKILAKNPDFFRFLKEAGVFERWLMNRKWFKENGMRYVDGGLNFNGIVTHSTKGRLLISIATSFIWDKTPEEDNFWYSLSNEWFDLVKEKENESSEDDKFWG